MSYLTRPLTNRAIHLKITPRPANLGEQREILRLLSQFGEVDYYKSLKYDGQGLGHPSVGLVIFKDEEGARNCFRGSPVRFRMGRVRAGQEGVMDRLGGGRMGEGRDQGGDQVDEQSEEGFGEQVGPWGIRDAAPAPATASVKRGPFGLEAETQHQRRYNSTSSSTSTSTSSLPIPNPRPIRLPFEAPYSSTFNHTPESEESEDRLFHIHTSPSRRNYRDLIDASAYHGCFKIDGKQPGQGDLAKRVPAAGLTCVDWRKEKRPWRIVRREREGWGVGQRLGAIWDEKSGKAPGGEGEGREKGRQGQGEAFGSVKEGSDRSGLGAGGGSAEGTGKGRKWGLSWGDVGIR